MFTRAFSLLVLGLVLLPVSHGSRVSLPASPAALNTVVAIQPGSDWWNAVTSRIRAEEYSPSVSGTGFEAPNRAQNFRARFGPDGVEVVPRLTGNSSWSFGWETRRYGREGSMQSASPVVPRLDQARVVYERPGLVEWYENSGKGLEQGFLIEQPLPGEGALCIAGSFQGGLRAEMREGVLHLFDVADRQVLEYGELHVWDAENRELPARLVPAAAELAIVIEDEDALYPVTVDPLLTTPNWSLPGENANDELGCSVSTAGDVNGDGVSDVVIGAHWWGGRGKVYVFEGGESVGITGTLPSWSATGPVDSRFGESVSPAGDVNGDGYDDILVGTWYYDDDSGIQYGGAYAYYGSATGLDTTSVWFVHGEQSNSDFGISVSTAGDVNGDGYDDVIVGANNFTSSLTSQGKAYVYFGSAAGLDTIPAWSDTSSFFGGQYGYSVSTAGDVNADGYDDIIIGAFQATGGLSTQGYCYAYYGSPTGPAPSPSWIVAGTEASGRFGYSVGTAGDVNGDGYADVVIGAPGQERVHVYLGGVFGLPAISSWHTDGPAGSFDFGRSVGTAGDVNGDGYADIIIGDRYYDSGNDWGRAFVHYGSAFGVSPVPAWTVTGEQGSALGNSVATAGDVNGDGFSDVIVGSWTYSFMGIQHRGRASVYYGSGSGPSAVPAWQAQSDQNTARLGWSVASAGDVNGDGYSDVLMGAPYYDNGQTDEGRVWLFQGSPSGLLLNPSWFAEGNQNFASFGNAVAGVGDVNGDGYSDVAVGASGYDNGNTNEGKVFLYLGSPGGLSPSSWSPEGNQDQAWFGSSVDGAGDVNGDGFSDVIVGAYRYSNGQSEEGAAFVYLGGPGGPAASPVWSVESQQAGANLGNWVAGAGDVNVDGFSDVIVGAWRFDNGEDNEGAAFLYLGTPAGPNPTPVWSTEGNQTGANLGFMVASAGDVNRDGYSDVLVTAPSWNGTFADEGKAWLFLGSGSGLQNNAVWSTVSGQASAQLGTAAGAGDVNGDGFGDFVLGAPYYSNGQSSEGRVWLFNGILTGFPGPATWTAEANQAGAYLGFSAAGAGDVNGDGFADLIVGADEFSNGQSGEGEAFVYYGNLGAGLPRPVRQLRLDGSAPIDVLGLAGSSVGFRIEALARTPAGRGRVALEWEAKKKPNPFDNLGHGTGTWTDTGVPAGGSALLLTELVTQLDPDAVYTWRVRVLGDSPYFPHSRWFWHPGNDLVEGDLRTGSALGISEDIELPVTVRLLAVPAPNPFAGSTRLSFDLRAPERVRLSVFDVQGRERRVLLDGTATAGVTSEEWDGRDDRGLRLPAGVYFARLRIGAHAESQKVVLSP